MKETKAITILKAEEVKRIVKENKCFLCNSELLIFGEGSYFCSLCNQLFLVAERTHSGSSIGSFKQCKKKYWFHYLSDNKKEARSDALIHGRDVHQDLEYRKTSIIVNKAFKLIGGPGKRVKGCKYPFLSDSDKVFMEQAEIAFALDKDMQLVNFGTENARIIENNGNVAIFRGKIDLIRYYINKEKLKDITYLEDCIEKILLIDWKTGNKIKNDKTQLKRYCLYVFQSVSHIDEIECRNVYVEKPEGEQPKSFVVKRSEILEIWEEIQARINQIRDCTDFYKCKSGLCNSCQYQEECQAEEGNSISSLTSEGLLKNPFENYI